jgi:hypothetical protein
MKGTDTQPTDALSIAKELLEPVEGFPEPTRLEVMAAEQLWLQHAHILRLESALNNAQPDCRTCHYFRDLECINEIDCTNGDKYQPAPKVVLWRTE